MSNVIARFRGESDFQPLIDARKLRTQTVTWILNENNIPKRKRFLFIDDFKRVLCSIFNNIQAAEYCFPTNDEKLKERISYISIAIQGCEELFQLFQFVDDVQKESNPINIDKLEPILTLNYELDISLKKWKTSRKVNPGV